MTTTDPSPNTWVPAVNRARGGYHRIVITPPGGRPRDVTFFRHTPTQLGPYSTADPFGDSTCSITFPQVSVLDDRTAPNLAWLVEDADVDIWWVPGRDPYTDPQTPWDPNAGGDQVAWINPMTDAADSIAPAFQYVATDTVVGRKWIVDWTKERRGVCVWQGYISSLGLSSDEQSDSLTATCQGALFQPDATLSKPAYPPRPQPLERLIADQFSHDHNRSLRTQPLVISWPADWSYIVPANIADNDYGLGEDIGNSGGYSPLDPDVKPGQKWTGYTTRETGAWAHRITDTVQGWLQDMICKRGSGSTAGMQWTIRMRRAGHPLSKTGRTPVLMVRDESVAPAYQFWATQPGVTLDLNRDATQSANALYGTGTDEGGVAWSNNVISSNGRRTDYKPLAADGTVYPQHDNKHYSRTKFLREGYTQFSPGTTEASAIEQSAVMLRRQRDPGYSGTITLKVDPAPGVARWTIDAGETLLLKGFQGSGTTGVRFHIASVEKNPAEGTVVLTVDTLYRDMLTLGEAIARTRDPLTPLRMLQLNANSTTIDDVQMPWSYAHGSGFIPRESTALYRHMPAKQTFPYLDWVQKHPPKKHPDWYVHVAANEHKSWKRWTRPSIRIRMAERGTIRRSEFFCVDWHGNLVPVKFHVSIYYAQEFPREMPTDNGKVFSPWIPGAFETIDPATGQPWRKKPNLGGDTQNYIVGWGNYAQPAGYSPGLYTRGARPTGLLIDESTWSFDCSAHNKQYLQLAKAGGENPLAISVYAMFYAEYHEDLYFGGRLYVSPPGSTG